MRREITLSELDEVFVTPDLYIGNFDFQGKNEIDTVNSSAYIARMTRSRYTHSVFLDHRTKTADGNTYRVNLQKLVDVYNFAKPEIRPIRFIFHTAFCGSTLMCRCLDKPGTSMPYKEPLPVHIYSALKRYRPMFADSMMTPSLVDLIWASVQKTGSSTEAPIVKPTDSCLNIGYELLAYTKGSRGLLMYMPLEAFLVSMLKHESRRRYVRENLERACVDLKDNEILSELDTGTLTDAKIAGLVWLALMRQYIDLVSHSHLDIMSIKSSTFFKHPVEVLLKVAEYLELDLGVDYFQGLLNDGLFETHSKSGIAPFDRSAYEQRNQEVTRALETEIQEGIDWVSRISENNLIPSSLPRPVIL